MGIMERLSPAQMMKRQAKRRSKGFISIEILIAMLVVGVLTTGVIFGARSLLQRADAQAFDNELQTIFSGLADITLSNRGDFGADDANLEAELIARGGVPSDSIGDNGSMTLRGFDVDILAAGSTTTPSTLVGTGTNPAIGLTAADAKSALLVVHGITDVSICNQLAASRPVTTSSFLHVSGGLVGDTLGANKVTSVIATTTAQASFTAATIVEGTEAATAAALTPVGLTACAGASTTAPVTVGLGINVGPAS